MLPETSHRVFLIYADVKGLDLYPTYPVKSECPVVTVKNYFFLIRKNIKDQFIVLIIIFKI